MSDCSFAASCALGIQSGTPTGTLDIDGIAMHCDAWTMLDLSPLWLPGPPRGSDVVIPGVSGVMAYRRRRTVATYSLPMAIVGEVGPTGTPHSDVWDGYRQNLDFLRFFVSDPTGVGDGTRLGTLTMPDGFTTRTAYIHVLSITPGDHDDHARYVATLDISIPAGVFA